MVGRGILIPAIEVRILAPQPLINTYKSEKLLVSRLFF